MLKKRRIVIVCILIFLVLGGSFFVYYYTSVKNRKQALYRQVQHYQAMMKDELTWLGDGQLSNGALPFRPQTDNTAGITSYFSDLAALALLQDSSYFSNVKDYIIWHFSHINMEPDVNGIAGTIYNYDAVVENGVVIRESTQEEYDSVDSYAATFLLVLGEYYKKTGDFSLLQQYENQLSRIYDALFSTFSSDGLAITKPTYPVKYLMDNCEVYASLTGSIPLLQAFAPVSSDPERWNSILSELIDKQATMLVSLEQYFWNETAGRYEIALDENSVPLAFSNTDDFYPYTAAQIFPILFGVIQPEDQRAQQLYENFCRSFKWETMEHYRTDRASFYWACSALAGAIMGDEPRVSSYMETYRGFVLPDREYPLYNGDAGWAALACAAIASDYKMQMDAADPLGLIPMYEIVTTSKLVV